MANNRHSRKSSPMLSSGENKHSNKYETIKHNVGGTFMYLETISSPSDVKALPQAVLLQLAQEIRETLLTKLSEHGGHIGPNLGLVETTIALHTVFSSPIDQIVYDVSHQSYVHKMLTGRKDAFLFASHYDDVSGYSNPMESEHDMFNIGHTSTSISLACGLAKARDVKGETGNVIALIGDGSLSGGEAFEGLNNAAEAGTNMIIIVNDNEMSIAENHGGLYQNLQNLRDTLGLASNNFFKAMGLGYEYVEDGHDINALIETFQKVKDTTSPVVVHIHTIKGKGYSFAQEEKEAWHWGMPFDVTTGQSKFSFGKEGYDELTATYLLEELKKDARVVAITSGTPAVFGFDAKRRKEAGKQFVDVGIAEEHAVAFASGIAAKGGKSVYGVYSTFLQRCYDQLSQDLCINQNPALLLVFSASIYGMNDVTHLGIFDIAMMSHIPNLVYLAPTSKEEYMAMLKWGLHQGQYPVAIRVPANAMISTGVEDTTDYSILNTYEVKHAGSRVAILGLGKFFSLAQDVAQSLRENHQIDATLINPKFITGLDESLLTSLQAQHDIIITLEDGIVEGGFGQNIASFYGPSHVKVKNYGIAKGFPDRYDPEQLMKANGMSETQIIDDILTMMKS